MHRIVFSSLPFVLFSFATRLGLLYAGNCSFADRLTSRADIRGGFPQGKTLCDVTIVQVLDVEDAF